MFMYSESTDPNEVASPDVAADRDSSPVATLPPASSKVIAAPRTIYVQPSFESQDESINLLDDSQHDVSMTRFAMSMIDMVYTSI